MATCVNHPTAETERACERCGRPFCDSCLVELVGRHFCAECRDLHVREMQRTFDVEERNAREALIWSCVGIVCCIAAPFGIVKGIQVLRRVGPEKSTSRSLAVAAIIVGSAVLALHLLGWVIRLAIPVFSGIGSRG